MDWSATNSSEASPQPQYQHNGLQQAQQQPQHPLATSSQAVERIHTIHTVQRSDGMEDMYLVSLSDGGKRVRRSHSELQHSAPGLLAAYLSEPSPSLASLEASSDLERPSRRASTGGKTVAAMSSSRLDVAARAREAKKALKRQNGEDDDDSLSDLQSERSYDDDDQEEESEEEQSSGSDFQDDEGAEASKSKRSGGKKSKAKSPKKGARRSTRETRHQKAFDHLGFGTQDSGADYSDDVASTASGARKSSRDHRKRSKYAEEGSDDDFSAPVSDIGAPDRASRAKARKSYGEQEQEYEYEEEPEELEELDAAEWELSGRPQEIHRDFCARCEKNAVPFLLEKIRQRRERNKGRKRKRKVDADLDEDTDQEEDRVSKLGAWFECGVCVQSYHFGCLPGQLRKEFSDNLKAEHLAAHNAMYPPPPPSEELVWNDELGEMVKQPDPISETPLPPREKVEWNNKRRFTIPKCWACKKVGARRCFVCHVSGRKIEHFVPESERDGAQSPPQSQSQPPQAAPQQPIVRAIEQPPQAMDVDAPAPFPAVDAPFSAVGAPIPFAGAAVLVAETPAAEFNAVVAAEGGPPAAEVAAPAEETPPLMFRCTKCKRPAHYSCLEEAATTFDEHTVAYITDGTCHECYRWQAPLDVILAWAEDEDAVVEVPDADDEPEEITKVQKKDAATGKVFYIPSSKDPMAKAKYLVKWQGFGYRQLAWVPHAFLVAAYQAKLSNFLAKGSPIAFEVAPVGDEAEDGEEARVHVGTAPLPDPGAEDRIPKSWKTPDRVLNVWYQSKSGANRESVVHANYRNLPEDPEESIKLVAECYFKWGDLPYSGSTIEGPLQPGEEGYDAYVKAYKAYIEANSVKMRVPFLPAKQLAELDRPRPENKFVPIKEQPSYLVGGKLMPFQVDGVNFLFYQWWKRTGCILADEMGLGKTVQIITLLSVLSNDQGARPFLVTVPNSTIGNWVREFERWAPSMRVVPYSGDVDSRRIIEDYELFDKTGTLKTHVVLATYEALEKNIGVFRSVQRWDCLVVDEGQRLKSGPGGHLWDALQSLNINHRVLLSGTPLNNNLTELFNLLNFIDPGKWEDQEHLTERYAELTPEKVEEVRGILKPYFLRRTKDLVLNLPPLTEIVVPVSMSPLQRQIYRGILERNASAIESIFQKTSTQAGTKGKARKTNFNNVLMELRKTLCHPYIISPEIEPRGVSAEQEHANLTEASAKFALLSTMLPKLHKAGHRVLIFSQFKLTLNIIESFLTGLRLKFLRLDGDTKQLDRQRGIDDFNAPDSDYFCYLLSTRAGGVGINLTTADTVIMYDQDFNPHQDIQAIARAHRIGQKKPVRVFKLLVKGTCEEKIFNAGNKKLGLDHLIIQRIDAKDESEDVEGILQYGAKAIFDDKEAEANAIHYSEQDVETLLARSAEPLPDTEQAAGGGAFAHAKIWEKSGTLQDVVVPEDDEADGENLHGFWAGILDKQEEEERNRKAAEAFNIGRGKRSRATVAYKTDSPAKKKKKRNDDEMEEFGDSSGDDFMDVEKGPAGSEEDSGSDFELDADDRPEKARKPRVPELARLEEGVKSSRKGRSSFSDPPIGGPNKAARDARRRTIIHTLALAAARFDDADLNATLERAQSKECKRLEQSVLFDEASKRIHVLAIPYIEANIIRQPTPPPAPKPKGKKAAGEDGKKARAPRVPKPKPAPSGGPSTVASDSNASTPAADMPDPATISSLPVLAADRPQSVKDLKAKTKPDIDQLKADVKKEKLHQQKLSFTLGGAKLREASMDLE